MQPNIAHDLDEKERTKDVLLQENVTFTSLLLKSEIQSGLAESGFKKPSPIQFKAIPLGRCGFDLIVKSKSGTGKTLVFATIALETVNVSRDHLQVIILVPTREIAVQIQDVLRGVGRSVNGLCVESFIGGLPLEDDIKKAKHCHIAVGAPGRVKHLIKLGALSTKSIRLFVLDEADKLMDLSFQKDINEIFDSLPQRKQIIASSATYPKELDTFLTKYMLSPTHVTSENETPLLLGLKQFVSVLKPHAINPVQQMKAKNELLLEIFSKVSFTQCLVFTNYQSRTESVCNFLNQKGWDSSFISAAMDQSGRLEAINNLKNFKNRILLSTDLTSRGIDAPNVDLVINYDVPRDAVTYLHRMGRAGRYGSTGICINFALEGAEINKLQVILGAIGATNLSISKLPPLNGGNDLWQLDPRSLEQIWGVVSEATDQVREEIKKEVLTLKQRENKTKSKDNKKIKLEELTKVEFVEDVLRRKEDDCVDESSLDAENLLNSLIVEDDDSKKRKRGIKVEVELFEEEASGIMKKEESILDSEEILSCLIDDDTKKRKLNEPKAPQNVTFSKNRALLTITKLLYNCNIQIDQDAVQSIQDYLTILKEDPEDPHSKTVEEILEFDNKLDILENIFQIGYESALSTDRSWLNYLPSSELESFQAFCREDQLTISSESEEDDYEMEEEQEPEPNAALQWVPVIHPEPDSDHFTNCFEDCSNVLWQTGLTFETVSEFDDWFYQWQEHLQSVRNYVQQNIYVEEMSKYQQNRLTNK